MFEVMRLGSLQDVLAGQLVGGDAEFHSVSTDSRKVGAGQLFIALAGERFDGHDFLADVAANGAAAALVSRPMPGLALPQLVVADTRLALGQLGALNRQAYHGRIAAVTGSSGKTTAKEMIASILRVAEGDEAAVLATRGNLNNDLGAPLTLLELGPSHRSAIIELGASRVGEIAYTVSLVKPQVSLLTNAGSAHVGEFGGPEKIVQAKGEIIEGLGADGTAVLNLDDKASPIWKARAGKRRVLSFSVNRTDADCYASEIGRDARGCPNFLLHSPLGEARVQLNLLGLHNVANAVAAAAVCYALGVELHAIEAGLQALQPVKGRGVALLGLNGVRLIDDSYNANPASMCAAIDILAQFPARRVLVLGDMAELGAWSESGHREVVEHARGKVEALYAVGPQMAHAVAAFGEGACHFPDQTSLIEALRGECQAGTTLLLKGSRSAAMDKVVAALSDGFQEKN